MLFYSWADLKLKFNKILVFTCYHLNRKLLSRLIKNETINQSKRFVFFECSGDF